MTGLRAAAECDFRCEHVQPQHAETLACHCRALQPRILLKRAVRRPIHGPLCVATHMIGGAGIRQWTAPLPINVAVIEHRDGLVLFATGRDHAPIMDSCVQPAPGLVVLPTHDPSAAARLAQAVKM